ncbi:hypothetical protein KDX23_23060 [Burkholderia vietnamiensis]|uniref:hypothetical protein n=1 Tax=Burkholderia vietnamiensis TaxID=60552 RepID=UPI001BA0143A|nr:hypothetical protein [Burkholderia vietnamiensis]MBR8085620.1 hypothetical protein [Burkholderia vietnamiensis]
MDHEIRDRVERELKAQPNRTGRFILSVANAAGKIAYELEPIADRQAALESLAWRYHMSTSPLRRALVVNSHDEARAVGTYFAEIDQSRRLANEELLVLERFMNAEDSGEYLICSYELKAAVESLSPATKQARPRI